MHYHIGMKSKKLVITLTESLDKALEAEVKIHGLPKAAIARYALVSYFEAYGHEVNAQVNWGGNRHQVSTPPGGAD